MGKRTGQDEIIVGVVESIDDPTYSGRIKVRVKGFRLANDTNDSWWGGNPLWSSNGGANRITVCIFGYVTFK